VREFRTAARHFERVVAALPADRLDEPGLGEWDLRALVGHTTRAVLTVETYLDRPAGRVEVESAADYYQAVAAVAAADLAAIVERGRQAGLALEDDPAGFVRDAVARAVAKLAAYPGDHVLETIAGGMRLDDYLPTRVFELVTHCLDIGRATGTETAPPPQLLTSALALAGRVAVLRGDGSGVLLALTGRTGLPPGFSVV